MRTFNSALAALTAMLAAILALAVLNVVAQAAPAFDNPTDAQVLDQITEIINAFQMGGLGLPLAWAVLSLCMMLVKYQRTRSLYELIPEGYRSYIPLVLGAALGLVDGLMNNANILQALLKGTIVFGGGQQLLYEQVKGTAAGDAVKALGDGASALLGGRMYSKRE